MHNKWSHVTSHVNFLNFSPSSLCRFIIHVVLQTLEESPPQQLCVNSDPIFSDYDENLLCDLSDMDGWSENETEVCNAWLKLSFIIFLTFSAAQV